MKNLLSLVFLLLCVNILFAQAPEWVVNVGVNISLSKTDAQGNIYGVGVFSGTIDFDPNSAVFNLQAPTGSNSVFVIKYDTSGNFVWAKSLDNHGRILDLELHNNELYIMGTLNGTIDFDFSTAQTNVTGSHDIFIAKYNTNADLVWAGAVIGDFYNAYDNSRKLDLAIDSFNNNLYLSGNFLGVADFDLTTATLNKDAGDQKRYIYR